MCSQFYNLKFVYDWAFRVSFRAFLLYVRPLLRFQDRIGDDLRHCGIREDGVEEHCAKRAEWRKRVYEGAAAAEKRWRDKGMTRRKRVTDLVAD